VSVDVQPLMVSISYSDSGAGLWDTLALNVNGTVNAVGKRTTFKLLACRTSKSLPLQPACSDTYRMCRLRSF